MARLTERSLRWLLPRAVTTAPGCALYGFRRLGIECAHGQHYRFTS